MHDQGKVGGLDQASRYVMYYYVRESSSVIFVFFRDFFNQKEKLRF